MAQLRVLVVGASIAGPTAAYWLAKGGASVTVIERFPALRTNGQAVDIRTTGVTVMRQMAGMEAAVRAKRPPIEGFCLVDEHGRPIMTIKPTGNPEQQSLVSEYEIYRGDLSQILFDLCKQEERIKYVFGEQILSIRQTGEDDGPLTVEFANGLPTAEYDLVLACDGANSRTRAMGFGGNAREHMHPTGAWAAYFSSKKDLNGGSSLGHAHCAVGGRFVATGSDPVGGHRVVLMGIHPRNRPDALDPFRRAAQEGDSAIKSYVAQHFAGAGWITEDVLGAMMDSSDFYASEMVQVKVPNLYRGRIVLVGDAGYAAGPTGTGTSLAMSGAYVLAGELFRHKGDLRAGLQAYDERMRPIITDLQKIPPFFPGILAPQTAWALWLRNKLFAFLDWTNIINYAQRLFGGNSSYAGSDKYGLVDYDFVN